jgi:hypothetical protein
MKKYRNLDRHQNLLNDVYATGKMSNELCIKHQVDKNTTRTLKDLKYITATGRSLISHKPSLQDVKKVIDKNRDRRYLLGKKKETQTKLVFGKDKKVAPAKVTTKKVTTKKPVEVADSRTTEINLFWGMIKIKR